MSAFFVRNDLGMEILPEVSVASCLSRRSLRAVTEWIRPYVQPQIDAGEWERVQPISRTRVSDYEGEAARAAHAVPEGCVDWTSQDDHPWRRHGLDLRRMAGWSAPIHATLEALGRACLPSGGTRRRCAETVMRLPIGCFTPDSELASSSRKAWADALPWGGSRLIASWMR